MSISPRQTDVPSVTVWVIRRSLPPSVIWNTSLPLSPSSGSTADVRRSYDYAKWLQLTSKVEHSHSQNYAAYSH